jgi:protein-disulfide isomerase
MAIVVMIATAAGCGSAKATAKPSGAHTQGASAEVASLLAGIPQHGRVLGDPRAPVVVQFFGDLQCPFCRTFALGSLNTLIEGFVRRGRLKMEYRSLKTATHDPQAFATQQVAALAAGRQNRMWNFIELFYRHQREEDSGYVTESFLQGLAQQVSGLNLIAWTAARSDRALLDTVIADARAASAADITSTPSFRLGETRRTPYLSAIKKLLTG